MSHWVNTGLAVFKNKSAKCDLLVDAMPDDHLKKIAVISLTLTFKATISNRSTYLCSNYVEQYTEKINGGVVVRRSPLALVLLDGRSGYKKVIKVDLQTFRTNASQIEFDLRDIQTGEPVTNIEYDVLFGYNYD